MSQLTRTVEETNELIRKVREIGNPKAAIEFVKLDSDILYVMLIMKKLFLKLHLDFGPHEYILHEIEAKNVIHQYDQSFHIWQHVVKIETPYNS